MLSSNAGLLVVDKVSGEGQVRAICVCIDITLVEDALSNPTRGSERCSIEKEAQVTWLGRYNIQGVMVRKNRVTLEHSEGFLAGVGDGNRGSVIDSVNDRDRERAGCHGSTSKGNESKHVGRHFVSELVAMKGTQGQDERFSALIEILCRG